MAYPYALIASLAVGAIMLAGAPAAASAQCRLCASPTTQAESDDGSVPLQLDVEAALDFDRLVLTDSREGGAALLPSGERSASGAVALVSARAMIGSVVVRGEAGRTVRIEMPGRIELHSSSGGRIALDRIETDLPDLPKLDSTGTLSFRFGGRLEVRGEAEGDYRGDIPITVHYL